MIAAVVGDCGQYVPDFRSGEKVKSPGLLYKHYSPRCQTALFAATEIAKAASYCDEQRAQGKQVAILCEDSVKSAFAGYSVLNLGSTENEMAARLYALLREAEKRCDVLVAIEPKKTDGVMLGVLNRLRKACVSVDIPHK
jgi:hypothetical protein